MKWIQHPETLELIPARPRSREPYFIQDDYEPYECPITGKPVSGRAAHRANLSRYGCHIPESGENERVLKIRERKTEELFHKMENTARELINTTHYFPGE